MGDHVLARLKSLDRLPEEEEMKLIQGMQVALSLNPLLNSHLLSVTLQLHLTPSHGTPTPLINSPQTPSTHPCRLH